MSHLLFQLSLAAYLAAAALYTVFFISQKKKLHAAARVVFCAAAGLHSLNIAARYAEAEHTPITSIHEIISFFAWSLSCCYLSFRWRYAVKNFGSFAVLPITALMLAAAAAPQAILPLPPELRTWLLPFHASISIVAYACLSLAAIGALMYLIQERQLKRKRFGFFYHRLPSLDALDSLNQHCIGIGFLLMTLGMSIGTVWAFQLGGNRGLGWHTKIISAMITWLLYAGLMHHRFVKGWRDRHAALLTVLAFAAVLLTLFFLLIKGGN
ncbi:cytochrome C assembly family protein [Candidatus Electronema sp. TJ]|uniref:cytochrome C assembly family protein n=1 Tax=Candidatus Electronema sp. TJ TaxID=3401573 RepID=UPI003AA829F3